MSMSTFGKGIIFAASGYFEVFFWHGFTLNRSLYIAQLFKRQPGGKTAERFFFDFSVFAITVAQKAIRFSSMYLDVQVE